MAVTVLTPKAIRKVITYSHLKDGKSVKTALTRGWDTFFTWALAPVLPAPLVWVARKLLVPVVTQYMLIKGKRAVINYQTDKQGKVFKTAIKNKLTSEEEFRKSFLELSKINDNL